MPKLPATTMEIDQTCATLNNRYQDAYNCYNELIVIYYDMKSKLKRLLDSKCNEISDSLKKTNSKIRMPSRENLEGIAKAKYGSVRVHEEELIKIDLLKTYFQSHKDKLEKMMLLTNNLSYSANQSNRMFEKSSKANGL